MPPGGFADPITSNRIGFRSNMPANELTEHITQAIEASGINSTPPVAKTMDGATVTKTSQPLIESLPRVEAQGRLDLQGDLTHGHRMIAKILGGGYVRIQEMHSPMFCYPPLNFQWHPTPATTRARTSLGG